MTERLKSIVRCLLPTSIYGPLRARRVSRLVSGYRPRTVEHDYAGHRLRIHLEDPLAEGWYDRDWLEPAEITELRKGRLRRGAHVLDIGAHQAVVALILARIVGREGAVVAVEAEPHNVRVAQRNVQANDASNVHVLGAAVGSKPGRLYFTESLNGSVAPHGRPGAIEVDALTVDGLADMHGRPDVVLVDVEGYEAHVLAGASATIEAATTDFLIELHSAELLDAAGSSASDVLAHFEGSPFEIAVALADDTVPGLDSSQLITGWRPASANLHRSGRRCFVIARAAGCAPDGRG